jgi:hypothetical protein
MRKKIFREIFLCLLSPLSRTFFADREILFSSIRNHCDPIIGELQHQQQLTSSQQVCFRKIIAPNTFLDGSSPGLPDFS